MTGTVAHIVDGLLGLHVDDFVGCGEGVHNPSDFDNEELDPATFSGRLHLLSKRFKFGSWDFGQSSKIVFCGAQLEQSMDYMSLSVSLRDYVAKAKPISINKHRKSCPNDPCDATEHRQFRALIGALAWPANQCTPELCASISLLQASASGPCVKDLLEANKVLRFAKEAAQQHLFRIRSHGSLADLCLGAYTDASWAVRPDGSSQGGMVIFACNHQEIESDQLMALTILHWSSKKLARVCRSSLSAEAQAAAMTVDELEWTKIFLPSSRI